MSEASKLFVQVYSKAGKAICDGPLVASINKCIYEIISLESRLQCTLKALQDTRNAALHKQIPDENTFKLFTQVVDETARELASLIISIEQIDPLMVCVSMCEQNDNGTNIPKSSVN